MLIIAVDAGTSIVKTVLFDETGEARSSHAHPVSTSTPSPGLAEQDFNEILSAVVSTVRQCVGDAPDQPDLIAITAQGDGLWLADNRGHPVRPGILWSDSRASSQVEQWLQSGVAAAAFRRTGNMVFAGSSPALLHALKSTEPSALQSATTAASPKDLILQRLTGIRSTDVSDASLPFLDPRSGKYDEAVIDLLGVRTWRHLLAPVDPREGVLRQLTAEGARLSGIREGTPVVAGPFDFPATVAGSGVTTDGDGIVALGTTLACGVITNRLDLTGEPAGMTISARESSRWIRLLPAMSGMSALDWLLPLIGVDYRDLDDLIASSPPGAHGVQVLPLLSPAGERAPFVDSAARGKIRGLDTSMTSADLARAMCEGIAYSARHCLEIGGLRRDGVVTLCGGGSQSTAFQQLLADLLGRRILVGRQPETGARGAAISALSVIGVPIDAKAWTRPQATVDPRPEVSDLYEAGYSSYLQEVASSRDHWSGPVGS